MAVVEMVGTAGRVCVDEKDVERMLRKGYRPVDPSETESPSDEIEDAFDLADGDGLDEPEDAD